MTASPNTGGVDAAAPVSKLGYVTFDTPDVERMVWYYTDVLDFQAVEKSADEAFLTTGADHQRRHQAR